MSAGTAKTSLAQPYTYIAELDGIRALAILAVMACHSAPMLAQLGVDKIARFGWIGVDVFFVLSGFLITRILLEAKGSTNYFKDFYLKRALRIWPVYFVLLLVTFIGLPLIIDKVPGLLKIHHPDVLPPRIAYIFFVQNFFGEAAFKSIFLGVTWSLAVEEQFYLLWPFIVSAFGTRSLRNILLGLLVLSPGFRWLGAEMGFSNYSLYVFPLFRFDGLALGSFIAVAYREKWFDRVKATKAGLALLAVGSVGSAIFIPAEVFDNPAPILAYSFLALFSAGLLTLALYLPATNWMQVALRSSGFRYIGRISYCLYLVHYPIFVFLYSKAFRNRVHVPDVAMVVIAFAAAIITATASWYFLESPILRFKSRLGKRPTPAGLSFAAGVES